MLLNRNWEAREIPRLAVSWLRGIAMICFFPWLALLAGQSV